MTEPDVKSQVDDSVYEAEVGVVEMVLDLEAICEAVREVRLANAAAST